jgi:solute carrier family 6 (neurotransmitter transporter, GABA) member 1
MVYFKGSFQNPLPWIDDAESYFYDVVIANPDPVESESGWLTYPNTAIIGETLGWSAFTFFLVWLSIFQGPSITGRVCPRETQYPVPPPSSRSIYANISPSS